MRIFLFEWEYLYIYLFQLRYQKCLDAHPQAARQIETTKVSCLVIRCFLKISFVLF
jgi:hypothetical protein